MNDGVLATGGRSAIRTSADNANMKITNTSSAIFPSLATHVASPASYIELKMVQVLMTIIITMIMRMVMIMMVIRMVMVAMVMNDGDYEDGGDG